MRPSPKLSWALYDWANSTFATTVMAGFFPVFFKQYWASDLSATQSTFWLGVGNALASLLIVVLSPLIGAFADQGGRKRKLLALFAFLGALMSFSLYLVGQGMWQLALLCYGFGIIGFSGSIVCSDALLVDVAEPGEYDRVSAFGFALGYLGGGLLFAINVLMVLSPASFGLADAAAAVRTSFLTVAVWWLVFSLPVLLFVQERVTVVSNGSAMAAFRELGSTIREVRREPRIALFLLAYWLYIDGVDTIVRMAVDYGLALGFNSSDLLTALLVTQFVGFPAALVFGRIGERIGAKGGILIGLWVYGLVVAWAWRMDSAWEFYGLAVTIGLVQGGVQSLSRSLYAQLIPRQKAAMFFGFYNMLGKFAAVLGPLLVGWVGLLSGSSRTGILAILILFVAGALLLARVQPLERRR